MDLQERLQAVQALHQELVQVIDAGERQIEEVERAREASIRHYQEARATAELRKSFLEGQMALLSEMMQAEALKQTQGIAPDQWTETERRVFAEAGLPDESALDVLKRAWSNAAAVGEQAEASLPMLNGTQDNSQPN